MALVAYDYSDSSDVEEESTEAVIPINKKEEDTQPISPPEGKETEASKDQDVSSTSQSLFNQLPQPSKKKPAVIEDDDEFLHKKEALSNVVKPKAKITVPSLNDFKDVEDTPIAKPRIPNGKKSGLLSILPQPKNAVSATTTTKSFVPHVLTQKPNTVTKKKEPLPTPMKKEVKSSAKDHSDDSDNDDEVQNDFFSINKPVEPLPVEDIPLDIDQKPSIKTTNVVTTTIKKQVPNIQSYFKQDIDNDSIPMDSQEEQPYENNEASSSSYQDGYNNESSASNDIVLDEEAILKLCGARGKRKREEIQIVDVNQKEVLADAREWLLKGLMDDTTKRVSASKRRGDEPTNQQRRKHQITYLAHQAKANEAELQNQWANNRMSKRQTQSKYGF